jgi:2,4-dienoyl-CoA reductase-like NADH-dependent reductase (Old Yellow Enzyme family)
MRALTGRKVVLAPLTRVRCGEHIPDEKVVDYYEQRATDGGLLITEATHISVMVTSSIQPSHMYPL